MQPLLSIVIANYNYGRFLEEAIQSVVSQDMGDKVELIICDAASADNSVDVIKKYANGLPANTLYYDWITAKQRLTTSDQRLIANDRRLTTNNQQALTTSDQRLTTKITWWCSEKDGGQSAAFNKGFSHAHGKFLTWLNADDVLLPGTLKKLELAIEKHPKCEWFVGGCFWLDLQMQIINCGRGRPFSERRYREGNVNVWGPSSFFTKRLLDTVGGVDERFHFSMDADLWLRFAAKANARYLPFCKYAWGLRMHPDAKMSGHNFTADGKFDTKHTEAEKKAASKHREQRDLETRLRLGYFKPCKPTAISRILSADWVRVILAYIDLLRFRGNHYLEYFK